MTKELTHDLLMGARGRLLARFPWYGIFASQMLFKESKHLPAPMGVNIGHKGINCYWNPELLDQYNIDQIICIIQHEIDHVVRLHCVRSYTRQRTAWNIAADAIVNGRKNRPNITGRKNKDGLPENCIWYEHEEDNLTTEEYYKWLKETLVFCPCCGDPVGRKNQNQDGQGGGGGGGGGQDGQEAQDGQGGGQDGQEDQDGQGGGQDGQGCPVCGSGRSPSSDGSRLTDDHDCWGGTTVSEDQARQMVATAATNSSNQAGYTPGHLVQAIGELLESKVNWQALLRKIIGRKCGAKRKTYSRTNRRTKAFGTRGVSTHGSDLLVVAVDTSGSVDDKMLHQFFSEVEAVSQRFRIMLVQFDHEIQSVGTYRKGDWKKIKAHGRGGTCFINLFEGLEERNLVGKFHIVLTDGEACFGDERPYPVLWAIDGGVVPPWGQYIKVEP